MPISGRATYTISGATSPTFVGGGESPGVLAGGQLAVTFGSPTHTINMVNFDIRMSSASYLLNGSTTTSTSQFNIFPTVTGGSCASCFCNSQVNGFFAGTGASRAGISYQVEDFGSNKEIVGAAALTKLP
jgi:hypothetical protein